MTKENIIGNKNPNWKGGVCKHPLYQVLIRIRKSKNTYKQWIQEPKSFIDYWLKQGWEKGLTIIRLNEKLGFYPENCILKKRSEISAKNAKIGAMKLKGKTRSKGSLEKAKHTSIKKYGTEYPNQSKIVKDKIKKTNLERYGVEVVSKSDIVKQQTLKNNREKYGVDHPQQLEENRQKAKQRTIDNGQANYFEGKTSEDLSKQIGISRSCMNQRIRKYGYEHAVSMDKKQSEIEFIVESILKDLNIEYKTNSKLGKYIPDFILEDNKLIIECDGLYWHSDAINKDKLYHKHKKEYYKDYGYESVFFREDEINYKIDIIKSIIMNKCLLSNSIYARKCSIEKINKEYAKIFFKKHHLMGKGSGDSYGLIYNNELYTLMQITERSGLVNISRFCHIMGYGVTGGFTKLISYVNKKLKPNSIQTFIDKRYGCGNYLTKFGFELINEDVSFKWVKNDKTYHRLKYRSNSGYDLGMYKLWDCGQAKYVLKNPV